jgi:hydrogenase maturation protease
VADAIRRAGISGVSVTESSGDPTAIMDAWAGTDRAVLVDAMVSGAAPGTVRRFDATDDPIPAAAHFATLHGMGAVEAVELARALGRLPGRVLVYGVEGVEFRPGTSLTKAVADGVEIATGMVIAEVSRDA